MRMWMLNPKYMCRKHLLGEHVEIHMLVGHLKRKRHIKNYIKNNCLEVNSINKRHEKIVKEMERRNYKHKSILEVPYDLCNHLTDYEKNYKVSRERSLKDLLNRCSECAKLYQKEKK